MIEDEANLILDNRVKIYKVRHKSLAQSLEWVLQLGHILFVKVKLVN